MLNKWCVPMKNGFSQRERAYNIIKRKIGSNSAVGQAGNNISLRRRMIYVLILFFLCLYVLL